MIKGVNMWDGMSSRHSSTSSQRSKHNRPSWYHTYLVMAMVRSQSLNTHVKSETGLFGGWPLDMMHLKFHKRFKLKKMIPAEEENSWAIWFWTLWTSWISDSMLDFRDVCQALSLRGPKHHPHASKISSSTTRVFCGIFSRCAAIYSCDFFEDSNDFYNTGFPADAEL